MSNTKISMKRTITTNNKFREYDFEDNENACLKSSFDKAVSETRKII